jgi:hypothetical protein
VRNLLARWAFISEHDGDQAEMRRAHEAAIAAYGQI